MRNNMSVHMESSEMLRNEDASPKKFTEHREKKRKAHDKPRKEHAFPTSYNHNRYEWLRKDKKQQTKGTGKQRTATAPNA